MEKSIPKVSIMQVKAARALLGWTQSDLANASKISTPTIKRLETKFEEYDDSKNVGDSAKHLGGRGETIAAIISALEQAGIIFIYENGEGPGVRLQKGAGVRLRK